MPDFEFEYGLTGSDQKNLRKLIKSSAEIFPVWILLIAPFLVLVILFTLKGFIVAGLKGVYFVLGLIVVVFLIQFHGDKIKGFFFPSLKKKNNEVRVIFSDLGISIQTYIDNEPYPWAVSWFHVNDYKVVDDYLLLVDGNGQAVWGMPLRAIGDENRKAALLDYISNRIGKIIDHEEFLKEAEIQTMTSEFLVYAENSRILRKPYMRQLSPMSFFMTEGLAREATYRKTKKKKAIIYATLIIPAFILMLVTFAMFKHSGAAEIFKDLTLLFYMFVCLFLVAGTGLFLFQWRFGSIPVKWRFGVSSFSIALGAYIINEDWKGYSLGRDAEGNIVFTRNGINEFLLPHSLILFQEKRRTGLPSDRLFTSLVRWAGYHN